MFSAVILSPDPVACRAIRRLCVDSGSVSVFRTLSTAPSPYDLSHTWSAIDPDIVFVSLSGWARPSIVLQDLRSALPEAAFVGFGSPTLHSSFNGPTPGGVDAYLGITTSLDVFRATIDDAIHATDQSVHDNLSAFLPAKAGSGCSITALNVAGRVAADLGFKILLIDGDTRSGILSSLTATSPRFHLQDLIGRSSNLGRVEWHSSRVVSKFGVDLLLGKRSSNRSCLQWEQYYHLLRFVKSEYDIVFVDLPEVVNDATAEVVSRAAGIFIVCTPELLSIDLARQRKEELVERNVDLSRVSVILNRSTSRGVPRGEVEDHLGLPVSVVLPNDYHTVLKSTLAGTLVDSSTPMGEAYLAAAEMITGTPPSKKTSSILSRAVAGIGGRWRGSKTSESKASAAAAPASSDTRLTGTR